MTGDYYTFRNNSYQRESTEANRLRGKIGNGGYTPDQVRGGVASRREDVEAFNTVQVQYHKVQAGETLNSIARKRGVTVEQICRLSHISKSDKIKPGRILRYS